MNYKDLIEQTKQLKKEQKEIINAINETIDGYIFKSIHYMKCFKKILEERQNVD